MDTDSNRETSAHDGFVGQASAKLGSRSRVAGPSYVQPAMIIYTNKKVTN